MTPTAQQLRASQHVRTSEKNLAVQAYAGTGKTTSIVDMVKCTSPREKVLALAFNKTNADDLRAKLPRRVDVKTLHGLAYGAVQRSRASKLEIDPSRQRWIIQKVVPESKTYKWSAVCSGVRKLTALAMNTLTLEFDALVELLWDYGVLPEKGVTPEQMAAWTMQVLELSRVPDSTISYDDMIFLAAVEGIVTGGYDVVFFDEAQDANLAQIIVLINSVRPGGKIVIVGDKHQCIYTWRGASARAFEELINRLQADVLPLSVTFRCPERVVELARCLVDEYEAAPGAPVGDVTWDTGAAFYKAVSPGHAVIGRSNWAIGHACLQLLRMGKKARVVGKDYGETLQTLVSRGDTNDIKALLEWIGPYVAEECLKHAAAGKEERGEQLTDACDLLKTLAEGVPNVARLRELGAVSVRPTPWPTMTCTSKWLRRSVGTPAAWTTARDLASYMALSWRAAGLIRARPRSIARGAKVWKKWGCRVRLLTHYGLGIWQRTHPIGMSPFLSGAGSPPFHAWAATKFIPWM